MQTIAFEDWEFELIERLRKYGESVTGCPLSSKDIVTALVAVMDYNIQRFMGGFKGSFKEFIEEAKEIEEEKKKELSEIVMALLMGYLLGQCSLRTQ